MILFIRYNSSSKFHIGTESVYCGTTGFIQASRSKFRTFQGLLKVSPTVFKDLQLMNNTDLSVKVLLQKC